MAHYLPVLLVSLTNAMPDDSSLTTAARAQVDYLSHDWLEEDVWRSWRNMTRQKKAIANGARLENASWRTWWKKRNKLGTVSPETLNWLKDSDVTWLYGPLHTATEWKPPSTQRSTSNNSSPAPPNTPSHNQTHQSNGITQYKPILKHRSISELLTSELPVTSPIFSPIDSEEDPDSAEIIAPDDPISLNDKPKRPALLHTKSDTIVTRWGSCRTFRKGSPSRISPDVPQRQSSSLQLLSSGAVRTSHSQDSNSSEISAASGSEHSQTRYKKKHISFNTFVEQCIAIDKPKNKVVGSLGTTTEVPWINGSNLWVDETGYEEDQEDWEERDRVYSHRSQWKSEVLESNGILAIHEDSDSQDEEDDNDSDDDGIEIRSTSSLTLRPDKNAVPRSRTKVSTASLSSSASTSTMSSSVSDTGTHSITDNTSSPSSSLSPSRRIASSSNISPKRSLRSPPIVFRRSSTTTSMSTYRPSLHRTPRPSLSQSSAFGSQHVTIAPIAPTLLKTTPMSSWTENLGDDGVASNEEVFEGWSWGTGGRANVGESTRNRREDRDQDLDGMQRRRSWTSGYGVLGNQSDVRGLRFGLHDDEHESGTPVELVYVPPSEYCEQLGSEYDEPEEIEQRDQLEDLKATQNVVVLATNVETNDRHTTHSGNILSSSTTNPIKMNVPNVIVNEVPSFRSRSRQQLPIVEDDNLEQNPYDYFSGSDMGDDYYYYSRRQGRTNESSTGLSTNYSKSSKPKSSSRTSDRRHITRELERNNSGNGEERQSRSRSRSKSRTPSPSLLSSNQNQGTPSCGNASEVGIGGDKNNITPNSAANGVSATAHSSRSSDPHSPPHRGRQSDTCRLHDERRGRSATRTSSSLSPWDRESSSSLSSTSPMGSLSPDGLAGNRRSAGPVVGSVLGSVLGAGRAEKEQDRDFETGRERRGRERSSKTLLNVATVPGNQSVSKKVTDGSLASAVSSSSSSDASTIIPKRVSLRKEGNSDLVNLHPVEEGPDKKHAFDSHITETEISSPGKTIIPPEHVHVDVARTTTPNSGVTILATGFSSSAPSSPTHSKARPPFLTLKPSPPLPAQPSTSFTAVASPTGNPHNEITIVGKAVDIVSSAGLYLGFWSRERSASAPSSPS